MRLHTFSTFGQRGPLIEDYDANDGDSDPGDSTANDGRRLGQLGDDSDEDANHGPAVSEDSPLLSSRKRDDDRIKCPRWTYRCMLCFVVIMAAFAIIVSISSTAIAFTVGNSYSQDGQFGPTETRLIPFSNILCQDLRLRTHYRGSKEYNLSLYMLLSQPGLFTHENFTISERVVAENEQHYLVYLHSGSEITMNACFVDSAAIVPLTGFYIVKGVQRYNASYLLQSDVESMVAKSGIFHDCSNDVEPFSYSFQEDDFYYLIFYTSTPGDPLLNLDVTISFYSTHYSLYRAAISSSCVVSATDYGSVCSVSVPLSASNYALLVIDPVSSDVDRLDWIQLETYCERRHWIYVLPPILLLVVLICAASCLGIAKKSNCLGIAKKSRRCRRFISCYCIRKKVVGRVLVFHISLVIILLGIIYGLLFTRGTSYSNDSEGLGYGPTDTRLIPFSKTLCQGLGLQANFNGSDEYSIFLYILPSQPKLSEEENFSIIEIIEAEIEYYYLFYLHSGSKVSVNTCFLDSTLIIPLTSLYVVKGSYEYSGRYLKKDFKSVVAEFAISSDCEGSKTVFFSVDDSDFYYFVYHTSGDLGTVPVLYLSVNMSFHSTRFSAYQSDAAASCNLSTSDFGSKCLVSVPYLTSSYALLSVQPLSSDVNRLDKIPLETYCEPRLWVYIVPMPLTVYILICSSIWCYLSSKKSPKFRPSFVHNIVSCRCKEKHIFVLLREASLRCMKQVFTWLRKATWSCMKHSCTWLKKLIFAWFKKRSRWCILRYCLPYLLVILLIGTLVGLRFTIGGSNTKFNGRQNYSPTDTRLIPFQNVLCQSLGLTTKYSGNNEYQVSIHMLKSDPRLYSTEDFIITKRIEVMIEQHYLFYMHRRSYITASACFIDSAAIIPSTKLYIVKGLHGYNSGDYLHANSKSVMVESNISYDCMNASEAKIFHFVLVEDFYYVIIHTDIAGFPILYLDVNMVLHRTQYTVYDDPITSSCRLSTADYGSKCSLSVPLYTSYALLTINPVSSEVDRLDEIPLETHCEPRLWVYLLPPLLLLAVLVCASVCCYHFKKLKKLLNCCSTRCWRVCYSLPFSLVLIASVISISLYFTKGTSYSNEGQKYGPTDTRVIPFSKTFCQGLSLRSNYNGSDEYNITLFALSSQPQLYQSERFTISERITAEVEQHYLFYMHPGSEVNISTCFVDGAFIPLTKVYIIKGIGEYLKIDSNSVVAGSDNIYNCKTGSTTLSYLVEENDFYYVMFRTDAIYVEPLLRLDANLSLYRTHYATFNDHVISSCDISTADYGSKCSVSFPSSTNSYALLIINPVSSGVYRLDQIPLVTECKPRLWVYVLPPSLGMALSLIVFICCISVKSLKCRCRCRRFICCCVKVTCKVMVLLSLTIVASTIVLSIRFTIGVSYSNDGYGPTDTRLIPFSNSLCQSLSVRTNFNRLNEYTISLQLLSSRPFLYKLDDFSVSERVIAKVEKHYLFYMHSGSEVDVRVCFVKNATMIPSTSLYIVKGVHGYGDYLRSGSKSVMAMYDISYDCDTTVSYFVEDDDFYYIIFHTSIIGRIPVLYLNVRILFSPTQYAEYYNITISNCSLTGGPQCSLSVPVNTKTYALLTVNPVSSDVNRLDQIPLETVCEPRYWVYVLPPITILVLTLTCTGFCYGNKRLLYYILKGTKLRHLSAATKSHGRQSLIDRSGDLWMVPKHEFTTIKAKFRQDWAAAKGRVPDVKAIFGLKCENEQRWHAYRSSLSNKVIERYYHGTSLRCNILKTKSFCEDSSSSCGACGISRYGFKASKINRSGKFQRFGYGFYLAPNSSKCRDYPLDTGDRAMILCDVSPGKKFTVYKSLNLSLSNNPPTGYDSIYGKAGEELNYDEIVLFNSDAILPKYLIIYVA